MTPPTPSSSPALHRRSVRPGCARKKHIVHHTSPIKHDGVSAFTLMEILIVMTLIGILATLTFTLGESIRERGKASQARVELAILSTALESFKSRYGDYPQMLTYAPAGADTTIALGFENAESRFFNALAGVFDPEMNPFTNTDDEEVFGKTFIEGAKFTFENHDGDGAALFPETPGTDVTNAFLDPWGRRYQYFYKNTGGWSYPGFVLYSVGSDGAHEAPPAGGYSDYDDPANIDNLYAGRN